MSKLTYSECTPFNTKSKYYSPFKSNYKNLRYKLSSKQTYTVSTDDLANFVGISYKLYGTVDLWRVILDFNGLNDPISDLYIGQVLQIPSKTDILTLLSEDLNKKNNETMVI